MLATAQPFALYVDLDGSPLDQGCIYFGAPFDNPETAPITVYWDAGGMQPIAQPVRTLNGCAARAGTPANIFASGDYSLTVRDRWGRMVYYCASAAQLNNSIELQTQIDTLHTDLASTNDASKGLGMSGYGMTLPYSVGTAGLHAQAYVSVLDYFTQEELNDWRSGTPVLDHTAAFNRATLASQPFTTNVNAPKRLIFVPGGNYKIDGTVYVRKGQHLFGAGGGSRIFGNSSSAVPTIKLGWGTPGGVPAADPGGLPPKVSSIHIDSGPASAAQIDAGGTAGYFIDHVFLSNGGTGLNLDGGDGIISDVVMDQCLTGMVVSGQNLLISNPLIYLGNYGAVLADGARDVRISNLHIEYTRNAHILLQDGATIDNVNVVGGGCLLNEQYASGFTGFVHNRANGAKVTFAGMTFRNMKGYAYQHGNGIGQDITFEGCIFDGLKTASGYAQSTDSGAISTANETVRALNCTFRNLDQPAIAMGGTLAGMLHVQGGSWQSIAGLTFANLANSNLDSRASFQGIRGDGATPMFNAQDAVGVRVKGCINWLGPLQTASGRTGIAIPFQIANQWLVTVRGNPNIAGDGNYRHTATFAVQKSNSYDGSNRVTSLTQSNVLVAPANSLTALSLQLDIGSIGAGATLTGTTLSGYAYATVSTNFEAVEIEVEQLL